MPTRCTSAVAVAGGWRFTSPDGAVVKTMTAPDGGYDVSAAYAETVSGSLYVRLGLCPNPGDLFLNGDTHLSGVYDGTSNTYTLANSAGGAVHLQARQRELQRLPRRRRRQPPQPRAHRAGRGLRRRRVHAHHDADPRPHRGDRRGRGGATPRLRRLRSVAVTVAGGVDRAFPTRRGGGGACRRRRRVRARGRGRGTWGGARRARPRCGSPRKAPTAASCPPASTSCASTRERCSATRKWVIVQ